ncbi:thioredoxin-like protein [Tuber brumale]|nr:thioredoxin-like protein [Tuber brumale]
MSEPVLRRSGRNIAKKEAAPPPPPAAAPAPKKRASAEPRKPAAKKAKTAVDKATAVVKNAISKDKNSKKEDASKKKAEGEASTSAAAAEMKAASTPAAPSSSSAAAVTTTTVVTAAAATKSAAKAKSGKAKAKKTDVAEEAAAALKEGDLLPNTLPEVQTHDGGKTTLASILAKASKGIVIFAYPKASTPECTTQACLFRDNYTAFTDAGYSVYGLSGDQPGANEKFRNKQNLTYTLLCDPTYELHEKLGIKKSPKGTIRSVIIIAKTSGDDTAAPYPGKILRKTKASAQVSLQVAKEVIGLDGAKEADAGGNKDAAGDVTLPDAGGAGEVEA